MRHFGEILNEAYSEIDKSVAVDSGLFVINEGVSANLPPTEYNSLMGMLNGTVTFDATSFVSIVTLMMNSATDERGTIVFTDNPSGSINNVAETLKNIAANSNGHDVAKKILFVFETEVRGRTRHSVSYVNRTALLELQKIVGQMGGPIADNRTIKKIIDGGGDFSFLQGYNAAMAPNSLDEMIRQGMETCREGGERRYLRYIKGIKSTTSVIAASTGIASAYSFFKGIYPTSVDDLKKLLECQLGGKTYELSTGKPEVKIDGSKGGRSAISRALDPKWEPPQNTDGTYNLSTPRMNDISEAQSDAAFRWVKAVAGLTEGDAYFENTSYMNALIVEDMHCFEKYFKQLSQNDTLCHAVCDSLGRGDLRDWMNMCGRANKIYFDLLGSGSDARSALQASIMFFRDTLRYRTTDGPLQMFSGANMFSYYVFSYNGGESNSGDVGYLLNHYPPGESKWTESSISNIIRVTDKTRTLGDRARQLIGNFGGRQIGGAHGAALRF